jgi:hypothetical protein
VCAVLCASTVHRDLHNNSLSGPLPPVQLLDSLSYLYAVSFCTVPLVLLHTAVCQFCFVDIGHLLTTLHVHPTECLCLQRFVKQHDIRAAAAFILEPESSQNFVSLAPCKTCGSALVACVLLRNLRFAAASLIVLVDICKTMNCVSCKRSHFWGSRASRRCA